MKLYEVELRKKTEQYIYAVEDKRIVSQTHLIRTINDLLNTDKDGKVYVVVTHVEAEI